ncbi:MAG: hypothetical protein DME99_01060 [Verrucomicrobia bacterium]|nr:MAG: hypothetical protein DME99_01060 [Verrucomicrobiota bacterium]
MTISLECGYISPLRLRGGSALGSARVSRVGFGVTPKQSLLESRYLRRCELTRKVRDREDALASTRDACATQS